MLFSSLTFLVFFLPIALTGYYLLPKAAKNYWLLFVSLFFYAWGAHAFVLVMILSILVNYVLALLIDRMSSVKARTFLLVLAVAVNLSLLFYNKYLNFVTKMLHWHVSESIAVTNIVLPIGISFFTFQAMSYVIDVYRGTAKVQKNPFFLGLYIAFFPQLIAGPIVRYQTIADQIEQRTMTLRKFSDGCVRFMIGFSEKILLANSMSVVADTAFQACADNPAKLSAGMAWIGAVAYSLQILFDFAGYSSMAIGLGKMFGFEFQENFNFPYIAKTVTEFWRRWHMSLGQWFRDYVYFPLGGSRVDSKAKLIRNLFAVWILTGIWHGADWTFLFWGLGYFILLVFEKLTNLPKRHLRPFPAFLYRIFTLLSVMLGWVLFRSEGLRKALAYFKAMAGLSGNPLWDNLALRYLNDYKIIFLICFVFCTPVFLHFRDWAEKRFRAGEVVSVLYGMAAWFGLILSISSLVMGANNPFIYFNF